jgi:hypothetical protein
MLLCGAIDGGKPIRSNAAVVIDESQPISLGEACAMVTRSRWALIRLPDIA